MVSEIEDRDRDFQRPINLSSSLESVTALCLKVGFASIADLEGQGHKQDECGEGWGIESGGARQKGESGGLKKWGGDRKCWSYTGRRE